MYHKTRMKIKWTLFVMVSLALFLHFSLIFYQFTDEIKKDYSEKTEVICNQLINNFSVRIERIINTIDFYNKYELSNHKFKADNSVLVRNFENITELNPGVSLAFIITDDYEYFENKMYSERYLSFFPELQNRNYSSIGNDWRIVNENQEEKLLYLARIQDVDGNAVGASAFSFYIDDIKNDFYSKDNMFTESSVLIIGDGVSEIFVGGKPSADRENIVCKKDIDNMTISAKTNYKYIFDVYLSLFVGLLIIYIITISLLYFILNRYSKYIFNELNNIKNKMEVFNGLSDWQKYQKKQKHILFDRLQMRHVILLITVICCFFVSGVTTWVTYLYSYNVVLNRYAKEYSDFVIKEMENNIVGITDQINSISLNIQSVSSDYISLQRTGNNYEKKEFINNLFNSISLDDSEICALKFITNDGVVCEKACSKGISIGAIDDTMDMLKNNTITVLSNNIIQDGVSYCMVGRKVFNYSSHYDFGSLVCLIPSDRMVLVHDAFWNNNDTYFITIGETVVSHTDQRFIGKNIYLPTQYKFSNNIFVQHTIVGHRFSEPLVLNAFVSTSEFIELINHIAYRLFILYCVMTILIFFAAYFVPKQLLRDIEVLRKNLENIFSGNSDIKKMTGGSEFVFLNQSFYTMATRIEDLIDKIEKEKDKQRTLEIELLHAQINPHFIYNVLDSISWEAKAAGQYKIDDMIITLGKYLRTGLHRGDNLISVSKEVEHVRNYLNLEKNRFGDMFDCCYLIDDSIHNKKMLKILLQPIVENCVKHAFDSNTETGLIIIKATPENDGIKFEVKDNGKGFSQNKKNEIPQSTKIGGGVGLKNINERLILWYGKCSELQIKSSPGEGTTVSFWIPFIKEDLQ